MFNDWLLSWVWRKQSERDAKCIWMEEQMETFVNIGASCGKSFPADQLYVGIEFFRHHEC